MRNEVIKILKKHTSFDINDSTTMEEIGYLHLIYFVLFQS